MHEDSVIDIETSLGKEPIHVLRSGKGEQRFLVWHGFNSVNRFYPWSYLEKLGELIRIGLPGHGPVPPKTRSDYRRWTAEHFVETALGIYRKFHDGRPFVVVGHSAGAHIALRAATRVPELVQGLILINPMLWSIRGRVVRYLARTALWPVLCGAALGPNLRKMQQSIESYLEGLRPSSAITNRFTETKTPVFMSKADTKIIGACAYPDWWPLRGYSRHGISAQRSPLRYATFRRW